MHRVDAGLAAIMENSPCDVPIDVRVFLVRSADLQLLEMFQEFASEFSVFRGPNSGFVALRATTSQINQLAAENAILRIEFDVEATEQPVEELPTGGRAAERYREFISGRYPDDLSLPDDSFEEEPDPDPDAPDTVDPPLGFESHPST